MGSNWKECVFINWLFVRRLTCAQDLAKSYW